MSRAWVRRATCIATCAHGLPKPWNTVSRGRMVRARATTNHSSIVQLMRCLPLGREELLPRLGGLGPGGQLGEPVGADRAAVALLAVLDVGGQVLLQVPGPGLGRRHVLAQVGAVVGVAGVAGRRVRPERDVGHGRDQVPGDGDAGRGDLLGGHQLVHGRDDHPRRRREPLVQHVRLLQVQVAVAVPGRRVQQGHVGAQRRHRDQRLPGERAGDLGVLGVQRHDVRPADPADRQERHSHLGRPELGQDRGAAALRHLDRGLLGGAAVRGSQAEVLLEPHVAFLAPADRPRPHQHVHVDAVRRPDQVQAGPALPDQLPDQGHGQPGGQAAAERDQGAVTDQRGRVGQAGPLVGRWVQAHGDPPARTAGRRGRP